MSAIYARECTLVKNMAAMTPSCYDLTLTTRRTNGHPSSVRPRRKRARAPWADIRTQSPPIATQELVDMEGMLGGSDDVVLPIYLAPIIEFTEHGDCDTLAPLDHRAGRGFSEVHTSTPLIFLLIETKVCVKDFHPCASRAEITPGRRAIARLFSFIFSFVELHKRGAANTRGCRIDSEHVWLCDTRMGLCSPLPSVWIESVATNHRD
jgi:hypothetical protein